MELYGKGGRRLEERKMAEEAKEATKVLEEGDGCFFFKVSNLNPRNV
jgi:hypothetical protein